MYKFKQEYAVVYFAAFAKQEKAAVYLMHLQSERRLLYISVNAIAKQEETAE